MNAYFAMQLVRIGSGSTRLMAMGLGLLAAATAAQAEEALPACPEQLIVQQTADADAAGWQAYNTHDRHPFTGVSFSEGSPDKQATLAPSRDKKRGAVKLTVWDFTASKEGYWLACQYAQTSATLARKLPDDVTSCEVEYDKRFSQPVVKQWHCLTGKTK